MSRKIASNKYLKEKKKKISHRSSSQKQFVLSSNNNIILLNSGLPPEVDNVFRAIFKHAATYSNTSLNNSPALSPHWRAIGVLGSTRSLRETNRSTIKCKPVISHWDPWSLYFSFVFIPGRQIWGILEKDNIPPSDTQGILDTSKTKKKKKTRIEDKYRVKHQLLWSTLQPAEMRTWI